MLQSLHVHNFALLEDARVEFVPGFNVFTGEIEKKNEFQRPSFIFERGSAEAGYVATDNALNELRPKAQERLQENEALMKSARTSAITQLTQLVNAVSLTKPQVIVEFRGGAGNE